MAALVACSRVFTLNFLVNNTLSGSPALRSVSTNLGTFPMLAKRGRIIRWISSLQRNLWGLIRHLLHHCCCFCWYWWTAGSRWSSTMIRIPAAISALSNDLPSQSLRLSVRHGQYTVISFSVSGFLRGFGCWRSDQSCGGIDG